MCERYIEWVASHMFPFENLACHPSMCPGWELNLQPVGLQASAQSTEPQQPGQKLEPFKQVKFQWIFLGTSTLSSLALPFFDSFNLI